MILKSLLQKHPNFVLTDLKFAENEDGSESVEPMLQNLQHNRPNAFG